MRVKFVIIAAQNGVGPEIHFDQNLGLGWYGKTYNIDSWEDLMEAVRDGMNGQKC